MNFDQYIYVFLSLGISLVIIGTLSHTNVIHRKFVIYMYFFYALIYLYWRFTFTVLTIMPTSTLGVWIWFCFFAELVMLFESVVFMVLMLRYTDRRKQAETFHKILQELPKDQLPAVDVMIPTYNEDVEVLERSILGALHLDWPKEKLSVWVLDDGKRDWLREFCQKKGAGYIRRPENRGAKAGNLNHAFSVTSGQFIAVFDADFIPYRHFLYRTLGFFSDPRVGILQTPQYFFNKDIIQTNLHLHEHVPDEQRLFFDTMMPSRDGWDAAFWCGSCSVSRRSVMEEVGGIPTYSITEDLLTTLMLLRHGFVTRYLNEKLSHGLAPESLERQVIQRRRWCKGGLEAFFSEVGPFGKGLNWKQKIVFTPTHWLTTPFTSLMQFVIPIVYLWTGLSALKVEHYSLIIQYQFPIHILDFFIVMWLAPQTYIPLLNFAATSLNSIQVLPETIKGILRLKNTASLFHVTPKGRSKKGESVLHSGSFLITFILFLLSFGGLIANSFSVFSLNSDQGFFPIAAFWTSCNVIVLIIMMLLCVEHPRKRQHERFIVNESRKITYQGKDMLIHMKDFSMGGALIDVGIFKDELFQDKTEIIIHIPDVGEIKSSIQSFQTPFLHVEFENLTAEQKDDLIRHIYTGKHDNHTHLKPHRHLFLQIIKRIFGNHKALQR